MTQRLLLVRLPTCTPAGIRDLHTRDLGVAIAGGHALGYQSGKVGVR